MSYPAFGSLGAAAIASSTTSISLRVPTDVVAGDILIAITSIASSHAPIIWPTGWHPIGSGFAAWTVATGGTANVTVSWTGTSSQIGWIGRWTGAVGVGSTNDNQAQSGSPATVSAITTTDNNSLCVAAIISGSSTTTPSLPAGFTNETTASNTGAASARLRLADVQVAISSSSSGAVSSAVDSGTIWRAALIELKPAAPVPPPAGGGGHGKGGGGSTGGNAGGGPGKNNQKQKVNSAKAWVKGYFSETWLQVTRKRFAPVVSEIVVTPPATVGSVGKPRKRRWILPNGQTIYGTQADMLALLEEIRESKEEMPPPKKAKAKPKKAKQPSQPEPVKREPVTISSPPDFAAVFNAINPPVEAPPKRDIERDNEALILLLHAA